MRENNSFMSIDCSKEGKIKETIYLFIATHTHIYIHYLIKNKEEQTKYKINFQIQDLSSKK